MWKQKHAYICRLYQYCMSQYISNKFQLFANLGVILLCIMTVMIIIFGKCGVQQEQHQLGRGLKVYFNLAEIFSRTVQPNVNTKILEILEITPKKSPLLHIIDAFTSKPDFNMAMAGGPSQLLEIACIYYQLTKANAL